LYWINYALYRHASNPQYARSDVFLRSDGLNAMRTVVGLFLLVTLLAACTQAPQPFRHERTGFDTSSLRLRDGGTVQVLPVEGTSIAMKEMLARALAESLAARNIPATEKPLNNPAYKVRGQVVLSDAKDRSRNLGSIYWTFMDRTNTVIHETSQAIRGDTYQWEYGDQALITALVDTAADTFAGYLQDATERKAIAQDKAENTVTFSMGPIKGAQGDGKAALTKAMSLTLRQFGARVRPSSDSNTYKLSADLEILKPFEGKQRIQIAWIVNAPDGEELGRIQQHNQLDVGVLQGKWGRLAYDISRAAMPGIGQVVERHRQERDFEASRTQQGTTAAPGRREKLVIPPF
jgi:hypothetical protein